MVSPFMSFATGALQAVDKNIDRYRAAEAAEEERADVAAQRMSELDFERETRLQAGRISADATTNAAKIRAGTADNKNFTTLGNLKIPKGKGAEGVTAIINYLASVPEAYEATKKDAILGPKLQAILANAVIGSRTMAGFYEKVSPMSKEAARPAILSRMFAPPLRNNKILMQDLRDLEDSGAGLPSPPSGTASQRLVHGEVTYTPDGPWVEPAVKALEKVNLTTLGRNMPEKVAKVSSMLGNYNPDLDKFEGNNKFWNAASSPFIAFIGRTGPSPKAETEEAMKWINNPAHGFVDVSESGVITKNNDYFFLVDKFVNQAAGKASTIYGDKPKTFTEIKGKIGSPITKKVEEIKQTEALAARAKRGLTRLKVLTKKSGTGSRITTGLQAGIPGFKDVVADSVSILVREVIGSKEVKATNLDIDESTKIKYFNPTIKALNEARASKNEKSIAAAEIRVMEVSLAYQLTSILQGGTGGRTISDQDVKMALELFTGDFITIDQKLAKIDAIMSMVDNTLERAKLYGALRDNSNANYYYAIEKLDRAGLIRQASLDTLRSGAFNARLNSMVKVNPSKEQEGIGPITKAVQDISKAAEKNPNFTREAYAKELENFLGGAEPLVSAGRYVLNTDDAKKWGNAVAQFSQDGDERALSGIAKGLMSEGRNKVFDAATGQVMPVQWIVRGGKAEFEPMKEGANVTRKVTRESSAPLPSKTSPAKKLFTPNNSQKIQDIENRIKQNKGRFVRDASTERELTELESQLKQLQEQ